MGNKQELPASKRTTESNTLIPLASQQTEGVIKSFLSEGQLSLILKHFKG